MPLTKLFKRRSSKSKKCKTSSEVTQCESTDEIEPAEVSPAIYIDSEVNELLQDLINKTVDLELSGESVVVSTPPNTPQSCEEIEKSTLSKEETDSVESSHTFLEDELRSVEGPKQKRSVSESHFKVNLGLHQGCRRKFGSESEVLTVSENIIPPNQRAELDQLIGKYVDKVIRESIVNAVKNVNVDNLYQEVLRDFSNRKSSESAESAEDFIVEQGISSNSISEFVDLESVESESDANIVCENSVLQDSNECIVTESIQKDYEYGDNTTLGGYLADYEDTTSVDDLKSVDEDSSICSISDGLQRQSIADIERTLEISYQNTSVSQEYDTNTSFQENALQDSSDAESKINTIESKDSETEINQNCSESISLSEKFTDISLVDSNSESNETSPSSKTIPTEETKVPLRENRKEQKEELSATGTADVSNIVPKENTADQSQKSSPVETVTDPAEHSSAESTVKQKWTIPSTESAEDLLLMCPDDEPLTVNPSVCNENENASPDVHENLPQQPSCTEEERKVKWKCGYLHVKLPPKSRGKTHLKAWKKRQVVIQPDEFFNDPKNPSLVISVYGADSRKHAASFWQTVSSQKAVVYRSSSRTHRYAFTISEEGRAIIHLSAENETATQEWMATIRSLLWPPSPFMQLEKMLNGLEFEISLIDNEFSYHAGLLGMYGYLTITPRKLILLHPQEGYVIQEWYLNTVDKFELVCQPNCEDAHKILAMTTCSDSSTGAGQILLYCSEAVTLLQSLASTIHQVLSYCSKQEGGKYKKELEEMAEWMVSPTQDSLSIDAKAEEHYKVPPRQVKSLLDIPNFIFKKSLTPVSSAIYPAPLNAEILEPLEASKAKPTTTSDDSGISTCHSGDDFLNCSTTSFIIGGGPMPGKSSDSELSDTYTPPRSPELVQKVQEKKIERIAFIGTKVLKLKLFV